MHGIELDEATGLVGFDPLGQANRPFPLGFTGVLGFLPADQGHGFDDAALDQRLENPSDGRRGRLETLLGEERRELVCAPRGRLQGFPDGYTAVPHRGEGAAGGPRYKALGNPMAVNVMRWIGRRIEAVERLASAERS
jgi:hypothetical protein